MTPHKFAWTAAAVVGLGTMAGCRRDEPDVPAPAEPVAPAPTKTAFELPVVALDGLDKRRLEELTKAEEAVRQDPDHPEAIGELGIHYLIIEHPTAAAYCFEQAALRDPENYRWHHLRGMALWGTGDIDQAVAAFEKVIEVNPDYAAAYVSLADQILERDPERAKSLYQEAIRRAPRYAQAYLGIGRCAATLGDQEAAEANYREALAIAPTYDTAHYLLAMLYRGRGELAKATEHLEQYQKGEPPSSALDPLQIMVHRRKRSPQDLRKEANRQAEAGRIDLAMATLHELLDLDPTDASAHHKLGMIAANQGRFEEAAGHFRRASELAPSHVEARSRYGQVLVQLGQAEEGETVLRDVLAQHPQHATTLLRLGLLMERKGELSEAISLVRRAAELQPAYAETRYELGRLLLERQQFSEAMQELETAVTLTPPQAEAHYLLGVLLARANDASAAVDQWQAAMRVKPEFVPPYLLLSNDLVGRGDYAKAVAVLRDGLRHASDNAELRNNLAWLLATCPDAASRDGQAAVKLAEAAVQQAGRDDAGLLDTLAAAYAAAGRFDEAVAAQQKAITLATAEQHIDAVTRYQRRLELFQNRQPYLAE